MQMNMGSSFTLRHKLEYTNRACTAVRTTFHSSHMIYASEFFFSKWKKASFPFPTNGITISSRVPFYASPLLLCF